MRCCWKNGLPGLGVFWKTLICRKKQLLLQPDFRMNSISIGCFAGKMVCRRANTGGVSRKRRHVEVRDGSALKPEGANTLVVRVDDFTLDGGIWKSVLLHIGDGPGLYSGK